MEIHRGCSLGVQFMVAAMSQCTCTTDKEATCIVHPTTRSLKEYIAQLENNEESYRAVAEYRKEAMDKLEAMLWMAYRKSGSPLQYRDWRRLMSDKETQNEGT
jgi:hypothetical protein